MAKLEVPIVVDVDAIREYLEQNDIVEVVRCKNCVYWAKTTLTTVDGEPVYDCPLLNEWGDENGFCSFGVRRN